MPAPAKIRNAIREFKSVRSGGRLTRLPVLFEEALVAWLRPVPSMPVSETAGDAALLAEWRNASPQSFFSWVTCTEASTRRWLTETYGPDEEDILFMIETLDHRPFGHLSLSTFSADGADCELGRVLRGGSLGPAGAMTRAVRAVCTWAQLELGVRRICLDVFEHNGRAIALYERCGFRTDSVFPLYHRDTFEGVHWGRSLAGSRSGETLYAVHMILDGCK